MGWEPGEERKEFLWWHFSKNAFFLKIYFSVCVCVCVCMVERPYDGIRFAGTEVTGDCELPAWVPENRLHPLQEQQAL
jgi:hypothetical protein